MGMTYDIITHTSHTHAHTQLLSRVHNKRRERECLTLTMLCTNALRKVCSVNYWILLFILTLTGSQEIC